MEYPALRLQRSKFRNQKTKARSRFPIQMISEYLLDPDLIGVLKGNSPTL